MTSIYRPPPPAPPPAPQKIMQVKSVLKTDTFSSTASAFTDITGLSKAITLADAANKVLLLASIYISTGATANYAHLVRLMRDATLVFVGDASGAKSRATGKNFSSDQILCVAMSGVDAPGSVGPHTYKAQVFMESGGGTVYINRQASESDTVWHARYASSLVLIEYLP